jgi:SNF2 family DNA or RNA helicase
LIDRNFGLEAQAIGRINRIGQSLPPTIERIVADDTFERQILRLAEKKRSLQAGGGAADEAVKNAEVEEIFGL